jgi:hypothetical protein
MLAIILIIIIIIIIIIINNYHPLPPVKHVYIRILLCRLVVIIMKSSVDRDNA